MYMEIDTMKSKKDSVIVRTAFRYAIPLIFIYSIYVFTHGEYSPGGGFQSGGFLAMVVVLSRLVEGDQAKVNMTGDQAFILSGLGAFLFAFAGWLAIFFGGKFLEYDAWIPFDISMRSKHEWGILVIEIGVTVCVMATIIVIYDAITRKGEDND